MLHCAVLQRVDRSYCAFPVVKMLLLGLDGFQGSRRTSLLSSCSDLQDMAGVPGVCCNGLIPLIYWNLSARDGASFMPWCTCRTHSWVLATTANRSTASPVTAHRNIVKYLSFIPVKTMKAIDEPTPTSTDEAQLRKLVGSFMVEATEWAEEHRRQLLLGSLTGIACAWHDLSATTCSSSRRRTALVVPLGL